MEKFNEEAVMKLRSEFEATFREFMLDSAKPTVKGGCQKIAETYVRADIDV